ncbi:MAG TPA: UDP-N-acetylglucosamine 1-carboxyvinyltransferase [Candidatus Kapabacteria bacterium]|nr:UDP-N-acetylglucosamine 1-carboxyvinyltransferase [Candidatus Kapabacteria bacterium]
MDKFVIQGGRPLNGAVNISGAKNATLELMPAALLAPGVYRLTNTPNIRDVWTMSRLMASMGAHAELNDDELFLDTSNITVLEAPYDHVKKMRASIHVLGPLLARYGYAKVSLPGGCAWGPRPVDFHLKGLERLGAEITLEGGYIVARAERLRGAHVAFDIASVGATFNIMAAATLARGVTTITNAAMEPEVTAAGRFLQKMGAQISGLGTSTITIEGVDELKPADEETIPDRIETGTLLIAIAITGGRGTLRRTNPYHLAFVLEKLEDVGCEIDIRADEITLAAPDQLKPVDVTTAVYPGFPTDMQAQWMALMACADGSSVVTDAIYKDRFSHVPELGRLGCDIHVNDNSATIRGGRKLTGATVMSTDLRGSVAMVLAALVADGVTEVLRIYHLDRGYERLEQRLGCLGAQIRREKTDEM